MRARRLANLVILAIAVAQPALCGCGTFSASRSPSPTQNAPAAELSDTGLDNLVAYGRLLGYVRHFHPSDAVAEADWNQVAIAGISKVESAKTPEELAKALEDHFRPLAPTVRVFVTGKRPPEVAELQKPTDTKGLQTVHWHHSGFGGGTLPADRNIYKSGRVFKDFDQASKDPAKTFVVPLNKGVLCSVPTVLFARERASVPKSSPPTLDRLPESGNDRSSRLAAVILGWNVFQHFYPYFDVVAVDWPDVLRETLQRAATDRDETAFLTTLRRMVARAGDGHGFVSHTSDSGWTLPPFDAAWVEGQLVVTRTVAPDDLVRPGDVIVEIDGRPTQEVWKELEPSLSAATEQFKRSRGVMELLRGPKDSVLRLRVDNGTGLAQKVEVKRSRQEFRIKPKQKPIEEVKPGVWYVHIDSGGIQKPEYDKAIPDLAKAKGIVFDLRGYPNDVASDLVYRLVNKPVRSANFEVPVVVRPDHEQMTFEPGFWPPSGPAEPMFTAKTAFIVNGQCISYAESILGMVEHYQMGAIVGEATAGTNGNVNPFALPGGYRVVFTGMRVTKHDGSTHHGIGIQPTVPLKPTLAGVRAGRDELLEKALEIVSTETGTLEGRGDTPTESS